MQEYGTMILVIILRPEAPPGGSSNLRMRNFPRTTRAGAGRDTRTLAWLPGWPVGLF